MEVSSAFQSFKLKKILRSSSTAKPSPSDQKTRSIPTEEPANPLRRSRWCLMSVKEVREAASKLRPCSGRDLKNNPDPIFFDELGGAPTRKPKKKKADEMVDLPDKCFKVGLFSNYGHGLWQAYCTDRKVSSSV